MAVTIIELTTAVDNLRTEMETKMGDLRKEVIGTLEWFKVDGERTQNLLEVIQTMAEKAAGEEEGKNDDEAKKDKKPHRNFIPDKAMGPSKFSDQVEGFMDWREEAADYGSKILRRLPSKALPKGMTPLDIFTRNECFLQIERNPG